MHRATHRPVAPSETAFDAQAAIQGLEDGICVVSSDWRVVFANESFARLSGVSSQDLVGRDIRETSLVARGTSAEVTARATQLDGFHREYRIEPRYVRAGSVIQVHVTRAASAGLSFQFRDVSEAVACERDLAEQILENASLRDAARALASEADVTALLRVICDEATEQCDAAGATVVEVTTKDASIIAACGLLERMRGTRFALAGSMTARTIAMRAPVRVDDYPAEHPGFAESVKANDVGPALCAPLVAQDEVLGVVTVARKHGGPPFREREERRILAIADAAALALWKSRLIEEAQSANRAKSEFMATVSHELRTPLTALLGYQELFADQVFGHLTEQQTNVLDRMRSSTQHLSTIIEGMLAFTRLEDGHERVRPRHVSVEEVLRPVSAVLEPLAGAKRLSFAVEMPGEPLSLFTDPNVLGRILVNLGANAVKFTERGSVTIAVADDDDVIRFAIRDTGVGIARADLDRLFLPFTQLDSGLTRRYGGTGLGLFVSHRLAQLLGGRVNVISAPNEGSTFEVVVPKGQGVGSRQ